jgi:hypothetical protein
MGLICRLTFAIEVDGLSLAVAHVDGPSQGQKSRRRGGNGYLSRKPRSILGVESLEACERCSGNRIGT